MKLRLFAPIVLAGLLAACADKKPHRPEGGPPPGAGGGGGGMGRENAAKIVGDLGLTEDQKRKYMKAMKEHGDKMKALRENTSLSKADHRSKGMALRASLSKEMHSILTPEQYAKWEKERQAMRAPQGTSGAGPGMGGGPGGPPAGGPPMTGGQPLRYGETPPPGPAGQ